MKARNRPEEAGADEAFMYRFPDFYLSVYTKAGALAGVRFNQEIHGAKPGENTLTRAVKTQIEEYLEKKRETFDLPLSLNGTEFQRKVWLLLLDIPYGQTRTYKEIAAQTGNEKACRAAGGAVHVNPFAILIPCHRVIGSDGGLTGFAAGITIKRKLLELEGAIIHEQ